MTDLDTGKTVSLQELMVSTLKIQGDTYRKYILDLKLPKSVRGSAISGELAGKIQDFDAHFKQRREKGADDTQ